ncbi:hypothetical protein GCM10025734_57750 [Kitasatospora paranensis]
MAGFGAVMNSRAGAAIRVVMSELDHEQALVFKDFLVARVVAPSNAAMIRVLARGSGAATCARGRPFRSWPTSPPRC